jgi:hypothetical protein
MIIEGAYAQDRCVFLRTDYGPLFCSYGLAYVKDGGEPEGRYRGLRTDFDHLVGRWWTFGAVD